MKNKYVTGLLAGAGLATVITGTSLIFSGMYKTDKLYKIPKFEKIQGIESQIEGIAHEIHEFHYNGQTKENLGKISKLDSLTFEYNSLISNPEIRNLKEKHKSASNLVGYGFVTFIIGLVSSILGVKLNDDKNPEKEFDGFE